MKLLTLKLMQFLPLSNDHYHIYFNTVWLISRTLEVKTKLLSKEKHYNAPNAKQATSFKRGALKGLNVSGTSLNVCLTL